MGQYEHGDNLFGDLIDSPDPHIGGKFPEDDLIELQHPHEFEDNSQFGVHDSVVPCHDSDEEDYYLQQIEVNVVVGVTHSHPLAVEDHCAVGYVARV